MTLAVSNIGKILLLIIINMTLAVSNMGKLVYSEYKHVHMSMQVCVYACVWACIEDDGGDLVRRLSNNQADAQ